MVSEELRNWITEHYPDAREITELSGDASSRTFYRFTTGGGTLVAMDSRRVPLWPWIDVHNLLSAHGLPVPELHTANPDKGFAIQEDLGTVRLLDVESPEAFQVLIRQALDLLNQLHRSIPKEATGGSVAGRRYFTASFLMAEMEHTLEHLFFRLLRVPQEQLLDLQQHLRTLCGKAMEGDMVLCHRDYHSANLMVKDNRLRLVDWQDARLGPDTYDAASLIRDSYRDIGEQWRNMALRYLTGSGGAGIFHFIFSAAQRNVKALGTFAWQYRALGRKRYLAYIPRTLRYLEQYPEFCPAVGPAVERIISLVETYTGEIDLRGFREQDAPVILER